MQYVPIVVWLCLFLGGFALGWLCAALIVKGYQARGVARNARGQFVSEK